jgi:dienelactone hydrolase
MPGLYVTANLYVPGDASDDRTTARQFPAILYVCGHSPHPAGAKWDYQDRAVWFADHGYVCLVVDTLEFGEVAGVHHGLHDLNRWHWLSRGYNPVGVEVWNAMRAVDYLETRPEVDAKRIGITGISGGGAVSWYAAAADERIAVSAPVCGTFTFGSQAAHGRASGQCDCIYYYNTFMTDLSVVAALIAPRPLLICSGQLDADFPPDGYHEVYRRAKHIYDLYAGAAATESTRIQEVDEGVGHTDSPLFRREARQWMNRWLRDDSSPLEITPIPTEKPSTPQELTCLAGLPADAINYRIDERFIPTAKPATCDTLEQWTVRRKQIVAELSDKSFRWFPALNLPLNPHTTDFQGGWADRYADYKDFEIETEPGVDIRIQLLLARQRSANTPLLVYAKRPGDSIYFLDFDELLPIFGRYDVAIVNPRMTEDSVSAAEYADIERTAAWLGRTVASMQVWDVLRAVEWLKNAERLSAGSISVYGKGEMGIVGLYAAILDERIDRVILHEPPATHRHGPALLNVLRITDIPEAAGVLAPRTLIFVGEEIPYPFQPTSSVYKLYGQASQIRFAGSLPEALEVWK